MVDLAECNDGKMLTDVLDEIEYAQGWKLYSYNTTWEYSGSCFHLSTDSSIAGYVWSFIVVTIFLIFVKRTYLFVKNGFFNSSSSDGGYIVFTIKLRHRPFSRIFAIAAFTILVFLFVLTLYMEVRTFGFSRMRANLIGTTIPFLVIALSLKADMLPSEYSELLDFELEDFKDWEFERSPLSTLFETNESFCLKLILEDLDVGKHLQHLHEAQESSSESGSDSELDSDS